ncbi:MAG: hypothetical protein KJ052_03015 [Candidatus Hydrogenedentes bacterium]|nr:hypothetical protein [Candidatus Hydrogenedentota bacterium]
MDASIATRVKDLLERQIALFEGILVEWPTVEARLNEGEFEDVITWQQQTGARTTELEAEFKALNGEWQDTSGISDTDRSDVQRLALRFEALAAEVASIYEKAGRITDEVLAEIGRQQAELRKARQTLRKLGASDNSGQYIDRKG